MTAGRGTRAGLGYGLLAILTLAAGVVLGVRLLPGAEVGDIDPLSASLALLSLAASLWTTYSAVKATRGQHIDVVAEAERLAELARQGEQRARLHLLGHHEAPIDVTYEVEAPSGVPLPTDEGRLGNVVEYVRHQVKPLRLVITGAPGAGKTVLAMELVLGLIEDREPRAPVPVRISARGRCCRASGVRASWDTAAHEHACMTRRRCSPWATRRC